jgi:hypothetical protein
MNIENHHGNQAACSSRAARYGDQLTLLAVVRELEDIAEEISNGRNAMALHAIQELSGKVLDDMRDWRGDHNSLSVFQPIHEINSALHGVRRSLLERRAKAEGWRFRWDDDAFVVEDDEAGVYLTVDAADNWSLSTDGTPDFLISDCGLVAMLAAFNGTGLAEEVSRLSRWLADREARR